MIEVVIPKVQAIHGNGSNGHHEETTEPAAKTEKPVEQLLEAIKSSLKEYSDEKEIGLKDAMGQWFGTRVWAEVEKMDRGFLETTFKKLDDELTPF